VGCGNFLTAPNGEKGMIRRRSLKMEKSNRQKSSAELTCKAFLRSGVERVAEFTLVRIPRLKPGGRFSFKRSLKIKFN